MKRNKKYYYCKENPKFSEMELNKKNYPVWKDSKKYVHRFIAKKYLLNGDNFREGEEVHHIDGDKLNFSPNNLIVLSKEDHKKITRRLNKERNLNKANILIISLVYFLFLVSKEQNFGIFDKIIFVLLSIGLLIYFYSDIANFIVRKTKLYRVVNDVF